MKGAERRRLLSAALDFATRSQRALTAIEAPPWDPDGELGKEIGAEADKLITHLKYWEDQERLRGE